MRTMMPMWATACVLIGGILVGLCLGWVICSPHSRGDATSIGAGVTPATGERSLSLVEFEPAQLPGADAVHTSPWVRQGALVQSQLRPNSYAGTGSRCEGIIDLTPCAERGKAQTLTMTLAVPDAPPTDQVWRYDIRLDDRPTDTHYIGFGKPETVRYDICNVSRVKVRAVVWDGGVTAVQPLIVDPRITFAANL